MDSYKFLHDPSHCEVLVKSGNVYKRWSRGGGAKTIVLTTEIYYPLKHILNTEREEESWAKIFTFAGVVPTKNYAILKFSAGFS